MKEERFRTLFQGVPACCWTFDRDGVILDWNKACETLYGWTAEQAVGKTMYDLMVAEENATATRRIVAQIFQGRSFYGLEYQDLRADGTSCDVLVNEYPIKDADGQVVLGICAQLDITERKQAEEALQKSEREYRAIAEGTDALLLTVDSRGGLTYVNDAVAKFLGREPDELLGRLYLRFVHPDDRAWVSEAYLEQIATGQGPEYLEFRAVAAGGEVKWLRFVSTSIVKGGQIAGQTAIALDITDRVRLGAEREQLLKTANEQRVLAETLAKVTLALTSQTSHAAVLDAILLQAQRIVSFDAGDIALLEGDKLRITRCLGYDRYGGEHFVSDWVRSLDTFSHDAEVVRLGKPLVTFDTYQDPRWLVMDETAWIRSNLQIPLCLHDRTLGVMSLSSENPGSFSEQDAERLQPLANAAAIALENARLLAATRRQAGQLEALYQVSRELATLRDLDVLLAQIVERAMSLLDGEAAGLYLHRPERDLLEWVVAVGENMAPVGTTVSRGDGLSGRVWESGEPLLVDDYGSWPHRLPQRDPFPGMTLGVPVQWGGRFLGVLNVWAGGGRQRFTEQDLVLLAQFAVQAAIAIENTRLVEGLEATVVARTAEIRAEQRKTETILHGVSNAIVMADLDMRIQYINKAYTTLTGYTEQDALGKHVHSLLGSTLFEPGQFSPGSALSRGEPWQGEVSVRRKDGRSYRAMLTIAPVHDVEGKPMGYVSSHADISQRKELEQARRQFMTNVTHELSTPVTNMQVYTRLLRQGKPEKVEHYIHVLEEQANRLGHLVKDILEMTALDGGQAVQNWDKLILSTLLRDIVTRYRDQAVAAGLSLEIFTLQQVLPSVWGDRVRLSQALGELIENAIIFTSSSEQDDGRVQIQVDYVEEDGQRWLTIAVMDNGPGISPEEQERVFDRFFRGCLAESGHVPGTGLGLSFAHDILQAHGGRLTVESELGRGSTFTLWLPGASD